MGHNLSDKLCLAGIILIVLFLTPCFYIDAVTDTDEEARTFFNKTVDLGYLVEQQLLDNRVKIKKYVAEIEKIKKDDVELLRQVLESNGVRLKENEGCDYNLEKKEFMFYDLNKP
jgi:hypothetical protein